jgi:anti-sigma factor RsiW
VSSGPTESSAVLDCAEMQRTLETYLDGELASRELLEAEAHLDACPACRTLADRAGRARAALRAKLRVAMGDGSPAGSAPGELRDRIRLALVRERRSSWRTWLSPLRLGLVAAGCTALLLAAVLLRPAPPPARAAADPLVEDAVRKHSRDLPLEVTAAAVGPESVAGWFNGKLDFNAAPPRFRHNEVRLVGARLSHILDRPAAYVRYDLPRGQAGLFILDDPQRRFAATGRVMHVGPGTVRIANARGFNVAVWRRNEIVYSLVSNLDEQDLARLVEAAHAAGDR